MDTHRRQFFGGLIRREFWLGRESSAVNTNRFWTYLLSIGAALCLVCLLRALKAP